MKQRITTFPIVSVCGASLILLLVFFNSCQSRFSPKAQSCNPNQLPEPQLKSAIIAQKGQLTQYSSPFSMGKVLLGQYRPQGNQPQLLQKTQGNPSLLPANSQLAVLVDNSCLQSKRDDPNESNSLSVRLTSDQEIWSGLDKQTFSVVTSRDLDVSQLETEAEEDSCLLGLSFNQSYRFQSNYNDPGSIYQGHLKSLRLPLAFDSFYDVFHGMPLTYNGREAIIAIVDTGVDYTHPDLADRMWRHRDGIGVDATTIGTSLVDFNPMDTSPNSHGTHVAGLAAAAGNNGIGTIGVMPFYAKIMAIRVFHETNGTYGTTSAIVANGIRFAIANGADVINLSLGRIQAVTDTSPNGDPNYLNAITDAVNQDRVVISAIGNGDSNYSAQEIDGDQLTSLPAIYAEGIAGMIAVGSIDSNSNTKSSFSHFSSKYVELAAPGAESSGTGLYSTVTPLAINQNQLYARLSGTSMSAPIVSGAAALTIGLLRKTFGVRPSAAEVERLITSSAIQDASLAQYFKQGRRLDFANLANFIQQAYPETVGESTTFSSEECR